MTMTKKDYEFLAEVIFDNLKATDSAYGSSSRGEALVKLAHDLADRLQATNPQFKRNRFLLECGAAQRSNF